MALDIKLIASDLDGTLLTTNKVLTDELYKAICHLQETGIIFVPATGRTLGAVPSSVREIPGLKYIITSNGAAVNDAQNSVEIASTCVDYNTALEIIKMAEKAPVMIEIFSKGEAFTEKRFINNLSSYGISPTHMNYVLSTRKPIENSIELLQENKSSIENINLIFADSDLRLKFKNELTAMERTSITSSSAFNLEITNASATKGNALNTLCKSLGIKPAQVLAFGDSSNDEDMLRFAGLGIAMANGERHIKDLADHVTLSCDENGVLAALKKFL